MTFRLLRNTVITNFNASPESGSRSKTITGNLRRADSDWETGRYAGCSGRTPKIQFKPACGSYRQIATVKTSSGGAFRKKVVISRSGTLRVVFAGIHDQRQSDGVGRRGQGRLTVRDSYTEQLNSTDG